MKSKILNVLLIITSLLGYLEWGKTNHSFLFQAEAELLSKLFTDPISIFHPFTLLPILGQLILLITLFQRTPNQLLTKIGIGSLSLLLLFMLVIGIMSLNFKIIISTIPFIVVSSITLNNIKNKLMKT